MIVHTNRLFLKLTSIYVFVQIVGAKQWHFCSSLEDEAMKSNVVNERLQSASQQTTPDLMNPDYVSFPKLASATSCSKVTVHAGDLIYYPPDYWHQTKCLAMPTAAISGTVLPLDDRSLAAVLKVILDECSGTMSSTRQFMWSPELCAELASSKCEMKARYDKVRL